MSDILGDLIKVMIVFIVVGLPVIFIFGQSTIKRILAQEIESLRDRAPSERPTKRLG